MVLLTMDMTLQVYKYLIFQKFYNKNFKKYIFVLIFDNSIVDIGMTVRKAKKKRYVESLLQFCSTPDICRYNFKIQIILFKYNNYFYLHKDISIYL